MEYDVTCPKCSKNNAYLEGSYYVCPDCDHEWEDKDAYEEDDFKDDDDFDFREEDLDDSLSLDEGYGNDDYEEDYYEERFDFEDGF